MKILIGCEYSGTIRDAMTAQGHDAWSCDLLPSDTTGNHLQCDVMEAVAMGWDSIILHPPCTALALCGNSTYGEGMPKNHERAIALDWTESLWNLARKNAEYVALENPMNVLGARIGYGYCVVHPWEHGHPEQKETWFWIHNLRALQPTHVVWREMIKLPKKQRERIHYMAQSPTRAHDRARTFSGIANAIADQWGNPTRIPDGFLF